MIASNRLPFRFEEDSQGLRRERSSGGLVSALDPVLRKLGGSWVGWPGGPLPLGAERGAAGDPYGVVPVALSEDEVQHYYAGFSNGALWPIFHSLPGRASFDCRDWQTYREVNARFADALLDASRAGGLVWVHDYHLMLVPEMVRCMRPAAPILFFLHIPFPPYDLFTLMPHHEEILRGVLGADVIGFHIPAYETNFIDCAERCLGVHADRAEGTLEFDGREVRIGAFPIGIDVSEFEAKALAAPPRAARRERERERERVIIGADRLDYTKGIPERIAAVERLLDLHPEHRERVTLLQISVPSRSRVPEYQALKCQIDELVGRVNGRFASASWSPIRYLHQSLGHDRLAALYRDADVALVTPLRDGMNLVAKEFVACQVADPGVLVLSRQAGAAHDMAEALLVNPYDIDQTAVALHAALAMPEAERSRRMVALRNRESERDVHAWVESLLRAAAEQRRA